MQELSERMQELFKDAVKNGEIDKETLQKMAESMQKMGELAGSEEEWKSLKQKIANEGRLSELLYD